MTRFLNAATLTAALLAIGAPPAFANQINTASATVSCQGFTITATGDGIDQPNPSILFDITLSPSLQEAVGEIHFVPDANGNFTVSQSYSWSQFNITIGAHTCFSGTATIALNNNTDHEGTIPIVFTPPCLDSCGTPKCTGAIGDFVWKDTTCNGIQNFGEPGTNGVTVRLKDSAGNVIATTVTGPGPSLQNGYYQFGGLCAGNYTVVVDTSTLPAGSIPAACTVGSDRTIDNNCSPAVVNLPTDNTSDQTIDFGYCVPSGGGGKTFSIGPSSMEGHLTILPGDWISGGFSFKFKSGGHAATQFNVAATVSLAVTCPKGGGAGGTIVFPLPATTYSVPANNTDWLPTGDANSVLSWMGSAQAPNLCNGFPMDNARGAVFTSTVSQNPATGSLVDFRFKYRDPNAKGKGNVNCLDTSDPRRAKADVCGASWSGTITDP
jgi:hypothetical protein